MKKRKLNGKCKPRPVTISKSLYMELSKEINSNGLTMSEYLRDIILKYFKSSIQVEKKSFTDKQMLVAKGEKTWIVATVLTEKTLIELNKEMRKKYIRNMSYMIREIIGLRHEIIKSFINNEIE